MRNKDRLRYCVAYLFALTSYYTAVYRIKDKRGAYSGGCGSLNLFAMLDFYFNFL